MTFSPFNDIPRHHPIRRAAAQCIRRMHNEARDGFDVRKAAWAEQRRAKAANRPPQNVWRNRLAVGCAETGELFLNIGRAAKFYRLHWMQVRRSCNQGRAVGRRQLTFVWLDVRKRRAAGAAKQKMAGRGLAVAA